MASCAAFSIARAATPDVAHRLFAGLRLPEAIRSDLHALQRGVKGARWVAPENLHITIRFIGELDGAQAEDVAHALSAVEALAFDIALSDAGTFASGRRPRMIWAGVVPSPALTALRARVDAALGCAGIGPEERKFVPHVTLARLRDSSSAEVARRVGEIAPLVDASFEVGELVLFESHLGAKGPHYEPAAVYPLAAA
jgi:2'-5' RNA ligase